MYHENIDPGLNGFWVEAKDLREGDVFIGANGELSTLVSNERVEFPDGITVYRDNDRIITMEDYAKLLEACPNQEWRTIIALARFGGLRCPSELKQLRWSDIDWKGNRFLVRSLKTERSVPLFAELRKELERHHSLPETADNEFVFQSFQGTSWNLYNQFRNIAKDAGLEKIVRPFDNMRMSRSNEIAREFGIVNENLWIGHMKKVMMYHYYSLTDEDYAQTAGVTSAEQGSTKAALTFRMRSCATALSLRSDLLCTLRSDDYSSTRNTRLRWVGNHLAGSSCKGSIKGVQWLDWSHLPPCYGLLDARKYAASASFGGVDSIITLTLHIRCRSCGRAAVCQG
jgi:hypothetical protein